MELPTDTGRVDGPYHAIYCREGSQLAAGEELCRQNLFHQGDYFSEDNAEWSVQKRLHRGIMLFEFYRTASNKHISAGNGDDLWIRQTVIPSQQAYTLYAAANYAFN